jgi:hypothetical protein
VKRDAHPGIFRFSLQKASPMIGFPLLLIPLAIYNIIAFLMPDVRFGEPLIKLALMSGAEWQVTLSDILLAVGILLLLLEVVKGARPGAKYLTDHLLSLVVFGAAAAEFVLWPKFGTSTYFLLTALALVDFLSGLALRRRRGAVAAPAPIVSDKSARQAAAPVEPAPAPPAAASVIEPVRLDHPEPTPAQPAVTPSAVSPEIPSPGLQPGSGAHPSPDTPPR